MELIDAVNVGMRLLVSVAATVALWLAARDGMQGERTLLIGFALGLFFADTAFRGLILWRMR